MKLAFDFALYVSQALRKTNVERVILNNVQQLIYAKNLVYFHAHFRQMRND